MKQIVVFENTGVIDIRSIKTFGVSAKESTNPIGYFGTGLKYAIAILLRTGHKIKIHAGGETFEFGLKPSVIRNKAFEIITMNGDEMPFTTELGKGWDTWMAFREIYCNCLDENGSIHLLNETGEWVSTDKTIVEIEGKDIVVHYHERNSIVLNMPTNLRTGDGDVETYRASNTFIYYRGIRVMKLDRPSILTYNIIRQSELTEDRTLKNGALAIRDVIQSIALLKDESLIYKIITETKLFEHALDFQNIGIWNMTVSPEFENVVSREFEANSDKLNATAAIWYRGRKNKHSLKSYQVAEMNDVEKSQLKKCVDICHKSIRGFEEYDIMVVKTLGEETHAIAEVDQQRIVLSKKAFALGTKYLLSTLIEEWMHIKTGYGDCTRQLQTTLFDTICTMIEDHIIKEPV